MARMTPPMNISGAFLLRAPFQVDPNKSYTVVAHRTFGELQARAQDPLKLVYEPVGLGATAYADDQIEGAQVICLRDAAGSLVYVPDTYIEQYPSMGSVKYSRLIAAVSLGMWPDYRDLDDVEQAIRESVKAKIGVDPAIFLTRAATSNHVSEQQHVQLTATRQAAITNTETDTATILRLTDEITALKAQVASQDELIEALVANQNQVPE